MATPVQSNSFSLLTWNVMGHSPVRVLFDRVIPELRNYNADIMCLQEGPDTQFEYEQLLALREDTVLASAKLFSPEGGWHKNYITTTLPVKDSGDVLLQLPEDCGADQSESNGYAMWADLEVGTSVVRLYNCHLRIRGIGISERLHAIKQVFDHAADVIGPVVICGDMNTTLPSARLSRAIISKFHDLPVDATRVNGDLFTQDERYIFHTTATKAGYRHVFELEKNTWAVPPTSIELFKLKLDWVLTKQLEVIDKQMGRYITDHRALFTRLRIG